MDVDTGLTRLTAHLPLSERQSALPDSLRRLHRSILSWFAGTGDAPSATALGLSPDEMLRGVSHLAHRDLVVVDGDGELTGAYPFTLIETPHLVTIGGHTIHAMCSLDALAIAPMFAAGTEISSTCAVTADPIEIRMRGSEVTGSVPREPLVGIGFQETGGCAATSLCRDMVFVRDAEAGRAWQGDGGDDAPLFGLEAAVELATRFFGPLVED